jgi:flagellar hook-basal body complex protein FliE
MVNSISLIAQNAYAKVNNTLPVADNVKTAVSFHDMVNVEFNRFASMSPDQILNHINNVKTSGVGQTFTPAHNGLAETAVGELRKKIGSQEQVVRSSLIDQASMLDLVTTTSEAKNTLQTMVVVRDKFLETFEKVMNMSI